MVTIEAMLCDAEETSTQLRNAVWVYLFSTQGMHVSAACYIISHPLPVVRS